MEQTDQTNPFTQYGERVRQRLQRMDVLLAELQQDGGDRERLSELLSMFHNLSGTGGSFGFFELSRLSRRGEAVCQDLLKNQARAGSAERQTLRGLIKELATCLESEQAAAQQAMSELLTSTAEVAPLAVVVLEYSDETREQRVEAVRLMGLPAYGVSTQKELFAIGDTAPAAVIADADEVARSGFQLLAKLRAMPGGEHTAIVLIGTLSSFTDRVDAIRHGADAYFSHTVDFSVVRDRLQELLQSRQPPASTILVVDDDPEQVTFLRAVLQPVGYYVHSCRDPRYFDKELAIAKPDLIILDIVMPGILGTDLARFIRQEETHRSIPIIILSALDNERVRGEAALVGADLVLQKPVDPQVLLASIKGCLDSAFRRKTVSPIEVLAD